MPKGKKSKGKRFTSQPINLNMTPIATFEQEYVQCEKELGNRRFNVKRIDGKECVAKLRGTLKRRDRVSRATWCLASSRPFEVDKMDILYVYKPEEVEYLEKRGELTGQF